MTSFVDAVALIGSPSWQGTATDLAALLPLELRPSIPSKLSIAIKAAADELSAAGIGVRMWRVPKSRRRMIGLQRVGDDRRPTQNRPPVAAGWPAVHKTSDQRDDVRPFGAAQADAKAGAGQQFCSPFRWVGEPCRLPSGTICRACGGGRWWSADAGAAWQCAACYSPPTVFPGQPPLAWVKL